MTTDVRKAALTDNTLLPKVADRLRAEIESGAKTLDIVTGYIAPSAWAVLGDALQKVQHTRILLGKDYQLAPPSTERESGDIRTLVAAAIRSEGEPPALPTRDDAKAVMAALDFLRRADVEVKVWTDGFLHAKTYILPQTAGVGSANFTAGGLVANRELVAWREDRSVLEELAHWFRAYWDAEHAVDYKERLIEALEHTTFGDHPYSPYELLIRVLAERYGVEKPPSLEAATFDLKWFQEDAVFQLIRMTGGQAKGALLADAVGLGKTYMALGVIHHYLYGTTRGSGSGEPILLIVPASLAPIWEGLLRRHGLFWACKIVSIQSLGREENMEPYQGAGLVVIDEAHRLRSRGVWYQKVMEVLTGGASDKRVLLLTATPVNTGIEDLTALLKVLTKNRTNVFAPAIADFERHLKRVEKGEADPFPILDRCVVRRSRSDIIRDYEQRRAAGMTHIEKPKLPQRALHHASYRYVDSGADDLFSTFSHTLRGLRLAPYDLTQFERSGQAKLPLSEDGLPVYAANSLAALVAAGLLKRFESSLRAIALSLNRLDIMLRRFGDALDTSPPRILDISGSVAAKALINEEREADEDEAIDFDARWNELLESIPARADPEMYDLGAIRAAIAHDRKAVATLRAALPSEANDGKIAALRALFQPSGRLHGKRALLFTQFRDTAVYVYEKLADQDWRQLNGVGPVVLVHGGTKAADRQAAAATFDPDQADALLARFQGKEEPQLMVSTDVLAEGHNLQLAEAVVNLDLHWNPQVAVQRAGRVDRLNSPHERVTLVSFLPEEGLDAHLGLIQALERRFRLIHLLGLGDEPVTKLKADLQTVTFEQMRRLYADDVSVLDEIERTWTLGSTDFMRAPLEAFLARHARGTLKEIPVGVQSIKALPKDWGRGTGVFIAFKFDDESLWRFYPRLEGGWGEAFVDETEIFRAIVCAEREQRREWPEPFPGPGGLIDWTLLHRAADEVADELTRRRATAALQRGASEKSRRMRQQIRELSEVAAEVEGVSDLLDRLEEVRVEDYDHRQEMRPFQDRLREARRAPTAGERHDLLVDVVERGLALFGHPQGSDTAHAEVVEPDQLRLVAWELLVENVKAIPVLHEQTSIEDR
jgi:superfamily II DNA or RNA helicase